MWLPPSFALQADECLGTWAILRRSYKMDLTEGGRKLTEVPRCLPCYCGPPDGQNYCATERNPGCRVREVILQEKLANRCPDGQNKKAQIIVLAHEHLKDAEIAVPISRAQRERYYPNTVAQGQEYGDLPGKGICADIDVISSLIHPKANYHHGPLDTCSFVEMAAAEFPPCVSFWALNYDILAPPVSLRKSSWI
jgi:hypothetical protein